MPRQRKSPPKPEAVILPPDLDDDDDAETGSVIPDDDGWIHLESQPQEQEPKRGKRKGKPPRGGS